MKGVGEQPAFEVNAVFGGAFAALQLFEREFYAVDQNFVVDDRSVERADELNEIGLALDEDHRKNPRHRRRAREFGRRGFALLGVLG